MKHLKVITPLIIINILLLLLDYTYPQSVIRKGIDSIIQPISQAVYLPGSRFINIATSFDDLIVENEQLRQQVREYFSMKIENERLMAQNAVLRNQLDLPERNEQLVTVASVVGTRSLSNNLGIIIDGGSNQDVQVGDIVVFQEALIGRIIEVRESSSVVLPLMANDSKIPVKSIGEKLFTGLIEGNFNTSVRLTQVVTSSESLNTGTDLYTSGLGETYPADIFVGTINEIESTETNVFKVATISIPWTLSELDAISIIRNQ